MYKFDIGDKVVFSADWWGSGTGLVYHRRIRMLPAHIGLTHEQYRIGKFDHYSGRVTLITGWIQSSDIDKKAAEPNDVLKNMI